MRPGLAVAVLGLWSAACARDEVRAPARGPRLPGASTPVVAPATPPGASAAIGKAGARRTRDDWPRLQPGGAAGGDLTITETVQEPAPDRAAARDFEAEVRAALGAPADCIPAELAARASGAMRIPVRLTVTPFGRVTRAEVGGALPEAARDCVRARAEAIALAAPVEGTPRTIATELVLEVHRQPPPTPPPAPEWRLPPGARPPAITLPAIGAEGRPAGSVPPDYTLPAVGAEGRPPGFVPPAHTLPAQGAP